METKLLKNAFLRLAIATATLMALAPTAQAVDILFDSAYNFREVRGGNVPLNFTTGDQLLVGISVTNADTGLVPEGAIVKARNTATNEVVTLRSNGSTGYFSTVPYSAARADGQWVVEVQSNVGNASALIPTFGTGPGTGATPLVQSLQATGATTNRGLTWTTPPDVVNQTANDGNIDRLRVRLEDTGGQLLDLRGLGVDNADSLNQESFQFDPTLISHNGAYVGQGMVE